MNSQRKSSRRSSGGKGKLRPTGVLNGGSRPAPYALWSGFTKESLPIGTEIEVDGYLEPQRPRDRPRCHVSGWQEKLVWHRPVPMLWTGKMIVGRLLPPAGPENTSAARVAWIQATASSERKSSTST